MNDELLIYLKERIERIDRKVDKLLEWKHKTEGKVIVASLFLTLIIQGVYLFLKEKV